MFLYLISFFFPFHVSVSLRSYVSPSSSICPLIPLSEFSLPSPIMLCFFKSFRYVCLSMDSYSRPCPHLCLLPVLSPTPLRPHQVNLWGWFKALAAAVFFFGLLTCWHSKRSEVTLGLLSELLPPLPRREKKKTLHYTPSINNILPWELQLVYISSTYTCTHRVFFFLLHSCT